MKRLHRFVGPAALGVALGACATPAAADDYYHRGFFLRLAAGGSYLNDTLERDKVAEANYLGGGIAYTIWAAGDIWRGMVLGGGATGTTIFDGGIDGGPKGLNATFSIIGPVWDYYIIPSQGFHLLVSGGLSLFDMENQGGVRVGFGGLIGAGYEWPMTEKWAVGILGQLAYGQLTKDTITNDVLVPTLQAAFTYY